MDISTLHEENSSTVDDVLLLAVNSCGCLHGGKCFDLPTIHCECPLGFYGDRCKHTFIDFIFSNENENKPQIIGGMVVAGFIFISIILFSILLWRRCKKIRSDNKARNFRTRSQTKASIEGFSTADGHLYCEQKRGSILESNGAPCSQLPAILLRNNNSMTTGKYCDIKDYFYLRRYSDCKKPLKRENGGRNPSCTTIVSDLVSHDNDVAVEPKASEKYPSGNKTDSIILCDNITSIAPSQQYETDNNSKRKRRNAVKVPIKSNTHNLKEQ